MTFALLIKVQILLKGSSKKTNYKFNINHYSLLKTATSVPTVGLVETKWIFFLVEKCFEISVATHPRLT